MEARSHREFRRIALSRALLVLLLAVIPGLACGSDASSKPEATMNVDPATGGAPTTDPDPATGGAPTSDPDPATGGAPTTDPDPAAGGAPTTDPDPAAGGAPTTDPDPAAGGAPTTDPDPDPTPDAARLLIQDVKPRLDALADRTFKWWLDHGRDTMHGGFHGTLDDQGNAVDPADKGLIQQSRHLWTLSTWYERREASTEVKQAAEDTYQFIITHMRDTDGQFRFKVSRSGTVLDTKKKLYAQAFAIYGLSTYGRVFQVPEAVGYALDCFRSIDDSFHDATYGGYDQTSDPDSWIGGAARGTNTHIHLMEAFTALAKATTDAVVDARLSELIDVTVNELLQPSGYLHESFDLAWNPLGSPLVSYGHDLETAWLLHEAARVADRGDEVAITSAARTMALTSAVEGYDTPAGGYFDRGVPGGSVSNSEKVWWAQFEALSGLWILYELTGDVTHLEKLEHTLDWIEAMEDVPNGEWFWGHYSDGSLGPRGNRKGEEWKTSYHNVRALVFTADWMADAL